MFYNVARSYIGLNQIGESFLINGKSYIKVELNNGAIKTVRAYSDTEYKKCYPDLAAQKKDHKEDIYWKPQKEVLGFINDYITIFKGNTYEVKDWFKANGATYTRWWGWSFASDKEIPSDIPEGIEPIRLDWEKVGANDEVLKCEEKVKEAVESIIYGDSPSEFQGKIGDRITISVTIEKAIQLDGYYGSSSLYTMKDENENIYVWTTTSKKVVLSEGKKYTLKGTVKDYKVWKNINQTVLTRCQKVEEI